MNWGKKNHQSALTSKFNKIDEYLAVYSPSILTDCVQQEQFLIDKNRPKKKKIKVTCCSSNGCMLGIQSDKGFINTGIQEMLYVYIYLIISVEDHKMFFFSFFAKVPIANVLLIIRLIAFQDLIVSFTYINMSPIQSHLLFLYQLLLTMD